MTFFDARLLVLMAILMGGMSPLAAHAAAKTTTEIIANDGIAFSTKDKTTKAVTAYDVVAAHANAILVADCDAFNAMYKNVKWCFASKKNLDLFTGDPGGHIPFLGGVCSMGVALGNIAARGDPRTAIMIGPILYLNGSFKARRSFLVDPRLYIWEARKAYSDARRDGLVLPN